MPTQTQLSFKLDSNHIIIIIQTGRKLKRSHAKILDRKCKHLKKNETAATFLSFTFQDQIYIQTYALTKVFLIQTLISQQAKTWEGVQTGEELMQNHGNFHAKHAGTHEPLQPKETSAAFSFIHNQIWA